MASICLHPFQCHKWIPACLYQLDVQEEVVKQTWIFKLTKGANTSVVFFFKNQGDKIKLSGQNKSNCAKL